MAELADQRDSSGMCHVVLAEGDTAPLPGTTKRYLKGPGWVTYQFLDGGASVELKGLADGMVTYGSQPA